MQMDRQNLLGDFSILKKDQMAQLHHLRISSSNVTQRLMAQFLIWILVFI